MLGGAREYSCGIGAWDGHVRGWFGNMEEINVTVQTGVNWAIVRVLAVNIPRG